MNLGPMLMLSGISNLALVGCFVVSANWSTIQNLIDPQTHRAGSTAIAKTADPLAISRVQRTDNEILSKGVQSTLKQPLAITFATPSAFFAHQAAATADDGVQRDQPPEEGIESAAFDPAPTTEETQGLRMAPILKKDAKTGQLEIGNFKSLSLAGGTSECLDMGYSMLGDTGTSNDLLQVLASTEAITVAKICARNGSVVITCRNDQITVSPRRSRPDDKCEKS